MIPRREFLARTLGATLATAALPLRGQADATPAGACGGFHLRYGVTQSGNFDILENSETLAKMGFDYCEPAVVKTMSYSDADFDAIRAKVAATPCRVESMNSFIPGDMKVVGPSIDHAALDAYVQKSLARANAFGTKIVVFGSGTARRIPEGFPREQAWRQLQDFLRRVGDEIVRQNYGFVIGIEALRHQESNIVNTTAEAYQLSVDTNHPKIKIICDFYHLATEHEDPTVLHKVKDRLVHLHFANECNARAFPRDAAECPAYVPFFANLRAIGYDGRISIEASTHDFVNDAPLGLAALHKLYSDACLAQSLG
ncbi:MAG TPA: sugar phosphate isomerase/epimerase family protein [Candidatus Acidoferrales bacterium]|nr:sugar phosphate isomerase/epimerase family protein [Candidatus Acidoferrales bacterium]